MLERDSGINKDKIQSSFENYQLEHHKINKNESFAAKSSKIKTEIQKKYLVTTEVCGIKG